MVSMEADVVCRECEGKPGGCARCATTGKRTELVSVWLAVPAGVVDDTPLRVSIWPLAFVEPPMFVARTA